MKTEKRPSRLSLPKTALPRIYRIDAEIAAGKYPNSDDLAQVCETSVSTISRDIDFMRYQLDAPIEYDSFERGYFYSRKTFRLPAGFSGAEDMLALGMAKSILSLYRETPLYEAADHLLESIIAPIACDGSRDWLENRIVVPPTACAKVDSVIWNTIIGGLKKNRVIAFDYRGTWDEQDHGRRVRPYQLLFDSGVWYLYGFAEERRAERIFSLSRIKNAVLTEEGFTLPKDFNYADFTGDSYFGVFIGQEKNHFAIDCRGEAVIFASERQWAADQKISGNNGGVTIEFTSTQFDKVLMWVLSCGCNAVPRKPKKLVDQWKRHVREMGKNK